ncbi:MAG TPA: polysaccharide biosynthesis tyrosine autokinase [Pyrinomonadaceae bacterium]|nr:polysaccharide biosynthesis tyrosine autokinase [Pyrinomonadaceae bacterium]
MKESREIFRKIPNETAELEPVFDAQIVPGTGRYPSYREFDPSEGFQLLDYWNAVRKRLWLVIGIAVLVTTLAAIYMARKPDIYSANARIQVDLEQTNPDLVTSDRQRSLANPDPSYFNTQLQLLGSDALLRRVIKEHNLDTNKDFQAVKNDSSGSAWQSMLKAVGLAGNGKNPNEVDTASANSDLASSDEIADAMRLAPFVDQIRPNLTIEPIRESRATFKDTRLIELSFRHTDPKFAAFLVNSIGETFVNANSEKRSGTSRKTNDFLQQRIADLQSEVRTDEIRLVELKQSAGILKTDGEQTIVIDRLSGLNKDLLEAENARKLAEAKYNSVQRSPENARALTEDKMARYITEQENSLRTVRTDTQKKISDLKANRAKLLEEFKEKAPEIQEIDKQIASLEDSIAREVQRNRDELADFRKRSSQVLLDSLKTEYQQTKEREDKIRGAYNEQYNLAQGQNTGEVQIKLLEQNIETNKGFLDNLRKQQSGNDVAAQGSDNNISIADYAIPDQTAISPRRLTTVLAALFLSTLFGMGLALFLEYLDDTISSTEEIESYLQLPALAAIPTMASLPKRKLLLVGANQEVEEDRSKSELLIYADSRSSLAEAYRQLRTSILLSTAGHAPKTLLVTSSLPSEGKTTTATNTAISLAQTGARVLIIDADMRKPHVHTVFNIKNGAGLSSVLSSDMSEAEILQVVNKDERTKVSILTCGPIPPNPAELIGSEQMSKLLKMFQKHFDHIVVDSPPISSFTDGVLVASMVDGVILVVSAGRTSRQVARRSRQLVLDVGARIFGVVLNNVNLNSQDNYYYYQSYYHRDDDE